MGLDASVRCRCFEEGRLKPGPVPVEDLYIDEEGYLSSRKLNAAYKKYDYRQYRARYGKLNDAFEEWADHACEHEYGEYCSEWVNNWSGVSGFEFRVDEAGGEAEFPLLSKMLPHVNGGTYPVELAKPTLKELDRFVEKVSDVDEWVLCDCETEEEVWTQTDGGSFTWMYSCNQRIGMVGGKVFFEGPGDLYVETTHFRQEPIEEPGCKGSRKMRIVCLDCDGVTEAFEPLGSEGAQNSPREFCVISKRAPFLWEGKYLTAERIRNLLVASIETGNPIRWC